MAPAVIETPPADYKSGVGAYKEFGLGGPKFFQKELELKGTEKHLPAKYPHYLPVWDNEKGQKYAPIHFATYSRH